MINQIYTATGCARCQITKRFLKENDISYDEYDFKGDGKEAFSQFYRANRDAIFRGEDGVEFPVFTDGKVIRQGVSVIIGYLLAGEALEGFIGRSVLHGEWLDGINLSGGNSLHTDSLLQVLGCLKNSGLKIQAITDGRNLKVLEQVQSKKLVDRVIMTVRGPAGLYAALCGSPVDEEELKQSIAMVSRCPDYHFLTFLTAIGRDDGTVEYLTPEEIAETARMIEDATGSKKHPYKLTTVDPEQTENKSLETIEQLSPSDLFKYRTAARRYMVMTELEK